jgi:hypothetical protein
MIAYPLEIRMELILSQVPGQGQKLLIGSLNHKVVPHSTLQIVSRDTKQHWLD